MLRTTARMAASVGPHCNHLCPDGCIPAMPHPRRKRRYFPTKWGRAFYLVGEGDGDGLGLGPGFTLSSSISNTSVALGGMIVAPVVWSVCPCAP